MDLFTKPRFKGKKSEKKQTVKEHLHCVKHECSRSNMKLHRLKHKHKNVSCKIFKTTERKEEDFFFKYDRFQHFSPNEQRHHKVITVYTFY